jgi:hypothetical protein
MAYIVPKVLIQQEFTQIPVYAEFPLSAFIIGPQYHLTRYDVEDEKEYTKVMHPTQPDLTNIYSKDDDVTYEFPNVPAGGKVDHTYTKVFFEDTVAKYFPNEDLGSANLQGGSDNVTLVYNSQSRVYSNRVRFNAPLTSDNGYTRAPWFSNRDVRAGDVVRLTDENGVGVTSTVKAVLPETPIQNSDLASQVGAAAAILASGTQPSGVVVAGSNQFTDSSASFNKSLEGQFITIAGEINQTFKILAVTSATTLLLDENAVESESDLAWRIGGMWADTNNVEPMEAAISMAYEFDGDGTTGGINTFSRSTGTTLATIAGEEGKTYTALASTTNSAGGSGATFTVTRHATTGAVATVAVVAAGIDYVVGDTVTIAGQLVGGITGTSSAADNITFTVASVDTAGEILTITNIAGTALGPRPGQENQSYVSVTGAHTGSGSGATFTVARGANGAISTVTRTAAGTGYTVGDTITILGSSIGGFAPTDNLVITVTDVSNVVQGGWAPTLNPGAVYGGFKAKRVVQDVYTVELDAYTGTLVSARFSIYSNSGAFAPRQYQTLNSQGKLTVEASEGSNIVLDFSTATDWVIGKSIKITAKAQTESAGFVASGTYTGTADLVYRIKVERGGAFYNGSNAETAAKVSVVSSGIDSTGSVLVSKNQAFLLGNFGATMTFSAGTVGSGAEEGLVAGDIFYVAARPAKLGAYTIIELAESLPPSYLYSSVAPTINIEFFLKLKSVEIPAVRSIVDNTANWTQLENYITVNAGTTTNVPSLLAANGPATLPVESARIFVHHRDLLQDNVVSIGSVRSGGEIERRLGIIHPDNPLAQGVSDAVLNASNAVVYFIGVESDDLAGYLAAIEVAKKTDKVYSFVPLTFDRTIQDAVVAHVNAFSTPEVGLWRIAWLAVEDKKQKSLYTSKPNGADWVGTVTDDPQVPGNQYRLVTIPGATFVDDGIRATDSVRLNFRLGADGNVAYDEYVVDEVRTQTTLVLTSSLVSPINNLTKVEIVRNYTRDERATNIAYIGGEFNNRRVRVVFPDEYGYNGIKKKGYFLAAALAGLRSGVVPHQGLTNTQVLGADDLEKVVNEFTQDQLNIMAEQGIWLVMQELAGATPFVRHQLTTDDSGLNTSEDSITTNVDNISYGLKHVLAPYIGTYNINPTNLLVIRDAIVSELTFRATGTRTVRAGNQLVSFTPKDDILLLQQNPNFKDRIDVEVRLNVPYPLNYINLKLIV